MIFDLFEETTNYQQAESAARISNMWPRNGPAVLREIAKTA